MTMAEQIIVPTASTEETVLAALALPTVVVLPGLVAPLVVESPTAIAAVENAAPQNLPLALFWSRQPDDLDQMAEVGVAARILGLVKLPNGPIQLLLQGVGRIRKLSLISKDPLPRVLVQQIKPPRAELNGNPLREAALNSLRTVASLSPPIPPEVMLFAANAQDAGELADIVAAALDLAPQERQRILGAIRAVPTL